MTRPANPGYTSRRSFLAASATTGVGLWIGSTFGAPFISVARANPLPGGTLDPTTVPKYVTDLFIPPAMPRIPSVVGGGKAAADHYAIAARQFAQQILPASLPRTAVWGYGSIFHPTASAIRRGASKRGAGIRPA